MKIIKALKLGQRLLISLDSSLPSDFQNHSNVKVGDVILSDALVAMSSGSNLRKDLSVKYEGFSDLVGKELILM